MQRQNLPANVPVWRRMRSVVYSAIE